MQSWNFKKNNPTKQNLLLPETTEQYFKPAFLPCNSNFADFSNPPEDISHSHLSQQIQKEN